jgi:tetratricopeptide (TPR) repeat protein
MSPEQLRGEALDPGTDLFSFGIVLYEMATGQRAFTGATPAVIAEAILNKMPEPPSAAKGAIPLGLEPIIAKALEKERALRYQSAADLRTDLQRLQRQRQSTGQSTASTSRTSRRTVRRAAWCSSAIVLFLVSAGALYEHFKQPSKLTTRDSILLADFTNTTQEKVFDDSLREGLAVHLEQSPFLNVVSKDDRVREMLRLMGRSPEDPMPAPVARDVCQRLGIKAMLVGSIAPLGKHYVIGLETVACQSGETLAREQVEAGGPENVLATLGRAATDLRVKLGESLATLERFDVPLERVTTSSLEALKAFSAAEEQRARGFDVAAIPLYKRAIELDGDFALAYGRLAAIYGNLGEWSRADEFARQSFQRKDRVSERERFYIASGYYIAAETDLDKYGETLAQWASAYPRDWYPLFAIADFFNTTGRYGRGLEPAREALRLNPENPLVYERLAETYQGLNDWAHAKATLEMAVTAGRDSMSVHEQLFEIAFVEEDGHAIAQQVSFAAGRSDEDEMLQARADAAAFQGHLADSRSLRSRAAEAVEREGLLESAGIIRSDQAVVESLCGERRRAIAQVAQAVAGKPSVLALVNAADALANVGDVHQAEEILRRLPPLGGWLQPGVTVTAATLEIQRGRASAALAALDKAAFLDLGRYMTLRPLYVRGLAYLALKDGAKAAREFQKIRDHRGIAPLSIIYPLAHLQQARAFVLMGDTEKARKTYESFLAIWGDADQDISVFKDAKREYSVLIETMADKAMKKAQVAPSRHRLAAR